MPTEATKMSNVVKHADTAKLPQLPPVSVDTMTQGELKDFIPTLLKLVTGRTTDIMSKGNKPEWWPPDVPWSATKTDVKLQQASWTETLRNIVRNCYKHLGQENLLAGSGRPNTRANNSVAVRFPGSSSQQINRNGTNTKIAVKPCVNRRHQYAEIYICYFCEKEFIDRDEMRNHQAKCDDRPPELLAVQTPPRQTSSRKGPPPMSPKMDLTEHYVRPLKDVFIKAVNILPVQKAARIRARKRTTIMDIDCDKIDLEDPKSPISPTTPRTPKSLISQLSREESVSMSKKRLSYSEPIDNSDKESVASGCSDDPEDKPSQKGKSLLTIDVSSLLGQRILKHIQTENNIEIVHNSEPYCKTPKKNDFLEKLRYRNVSFPIAFKPRKKFQTKFFHEYKFTKKQRKEFVSRKNTGLNRRSRALKRSVPKCRVFVQRLTKKDLKKWLSPFMYRKTIGAPAQSQVDDCIFPKDPLLLSKDLDRLLGLKRRSLDEMHKSLPPLQLANVVSEDVNAETSKQKLTLYRCLLSEVSGMGSAFGEKYNKKKLQQEKKALAESNKKAESTSVLRKALERPLLNSPLLMTCSPRSSFGTPGQSSYLSTPSPDFGMFRKPQRQDDDISILSISSDEESLKSGCCTECRYRKQCKCSPEVPAQISPCTPMSPPAIAGLAVLTKRQQSLPKVPLNVPLTIDPGCDLSSANNDSKTLSPPLSDGDIITRSFPPSPPSSARNSISSSGSLTTMSYDDEEDDKEVVFQINMKKGKEPEMVMTRSKSTPVKVSTRATPQRKSSSLTSSLKQKLDTENVKKAVSPTKKLSVSKEMPTKTRTSPRKVNIISVDEAAKICIKRRMSFSDSSSLRSAVISKVKRSESVSSSPNVSPVKKGNRTTDNLNINGSGSNSIEISRRSKRINSSSNSPYSSPSKLRRIETR